MPDNPNCYKTWASLRLRGPAFDAGEVTQLLGISPTEAFSAGDPYRGGVRRRSLWLLSSRDHLQSTDLRDHLTWLLDRLEPVQEEIAALLGRAIMRADFRCVWLSATGEGGPILSSALLGRLAVFGLNFSVSFTDLSGPSEQTAVLQEDPQ
jgi:hypothetical protein